MVVVVVAVAVVVDVVVGAIDAVVGSQGCKRETPPTQVSFGHVALIMKASWAQHCSVHSSSLHIRRSCDVWLWQWMADSQ